MKRVLALALCLMLCAGMLIGCASDGTDANHVHTFDYSKWSYDANGHWFNATCDCEVVTEEKLKHVDENKDGACDACKYVYECKDGHTYSEEWSVDCTNHFKLANCGHVTAPYAVAAHADGNGDGVCDTCAYVIEDLHEHYYDTAWTSDSEYHWHAALCEHGVEIADKAAHEKDATGHCTVCGYQLETIAAGDFQAMINAALASNGKVVSANVLASQISMGGSGDDMFVENALTDDVYFVLGPDDTYVFWKSFDASGAFIGADEYWYEHVGDDVVEGVGKTYGSYQLVPVMGDMKLLNGYNYIPGGILPSNSDDTSTLANLVSALYAIKTAGVNVSNAVEEYDEEEGVYAFGYNYFTVNATTMSDDTTEYQVYYYETVVTFSVDENFVIDNAMILVDSYRNWELDNDLDYDPTANTVTLKDTANPSRYTYFVAQTSGERTFTTPYPREALIPTDFELYNGKGDWSDGVPPVLIIDEYELIEDTVTFTEGDTVRLFLDDLDPITASTMFINEADITVTAVNKDAESDGELFVANEFSPYYSKDYGFIGFTAKDAGSYDVTVKYGDVEKTFVAVVEEPQSDIGDLEDNQFVVETTDTYSWIDEYVFTAEDGEGTYILTLPAGLGLWSKNNLDNNPFGAPEVDFYDNSNGETVEIELEAGATYTFYVGALTKGEWVISYGYVASEVEGGDGDNAGGDDVGGGSIAADISGVYYTRDGVLTINNDGTMTYVAGGRTQNYTYVIEDNNVTYTLNGNDPYDKENGMATFFGMLIFGNDGMPTAFAYEMNELPLSTTAPGGDGGDTPGGDGGDTPGGDDPAPTLPVLNLGANTIVLEEADLEEGKDYSFIAAEDGNYTVIGDLLAIFFDSTGMQIGRGMASLTAGNYTVKFVSLMGAGSYNVNVTFEAPSSGEGDGTEGNPYVWSELPEEVTFVSDTQNKVYYLFTATENGKITFTWPTDDSWANWYLMDGEYTTSTEGSSNEKTTMEVIVSAGETYRIGLGTYYVSGEVTLTVAFEAGEFGGSEEGEITSSGLIYEEENTLTFDEEDITMGKVYYSFTPYNSGEYSFESNWIYASGVLLDGVRLERNDNYRFVLESYTTYLVEINTSSLSAGEYTLTPTFHYPEGHQNNPFYYILGENATANYDGENTVWYQFFADMTGTLTVTTDLSANEKAVLMITKVFGNEVTSVIYDEEWNASYGASVSLPVTKGAKYFIGVYNGAWGEEADISFVATITEGDIVADGSANIPYDISLGSNTASVVSGENEYFAYKFPSSGILTVTTENALVSWVLTLDLNGEILYVTDTTISIEGDMDDIVYLAVGTSDWSTADIVFTASCELDPVEVPYNNYVITDGSAANEIVIENENSFVTLSFGGMGSKYTVTWDNPDAIVEILAWGAPNTPVLNGATVEASWMGLNLSISLPDYAAGTVNVTIEQVLDPTYSLVIGDNTVSITNTQWGNEASFTAPEAGEYTFTMGANAVADYLGSFYYESESFIVELAEGETVYFNVMSGDYTMCDVTVNVTRNEIGAVEIPDSISGDYRYTDPASWQHSWLITVNTDGTGVIAEQNFAGVSWNTVAEDAFTYTYEAGIITIDFANGTIAPDGAYSANAETISGIEIGGASATFEIVT